MSYIDFQKWSILFFQIDCSNKERTRGVQHIDIKVNFLACCNYENISVSGLMWLKNSTFPAAIFDKNGINFLSEQHLHSSIYGNCHITALYYFMNLVIVEHWQQSSTIFLQHSTSIILQNSTMTSYKVRYLHSMYIIKHWSFYKFKHRSFYNIQHRSFYKIQQWHSTTFIIDILHHSRSIIIQHLT